jgi:hypothetical protein
MAENSPKSSTFDYIKIAKQTISTVVLEWKYNHNEDDGEVKPDEIVFKIVKLKNRNEWETLCWSRKSSCVIKNLEQNTCYSIKVLAMVQKYERFEEIGSSNILKVN